MRDQVIALEHKSYGVISVGVPVSVLVFFGTYPVYDQIPGSILVESAEYVEHSGFAASGRTQDRDKFALTKSKVDIPEGMHDLRTGPVFF